jgi:hypothetical protein
MMLTEYMATLKEPWLWRMVIFYLLPWCVGIIFIVFLIVSFYFQWLWRFKKR